MFNDKHKSHYVITSLVVLISCIPVLRPARAETYVYDRQWPVPQPVGIAVDPSANLVVTDVSNMQVLRFDNRGARLGAWGSYGSAIGQFLMPTGVALDDSGNIYVADGDAICIFKFTCNGTFLRKWGGTNQFIHPVSVAWHDGALYVSDGYRVQKFDRDGVFLGRWGSRGKGVGQCGAYTSLCVDPFGYVYVSDFENNRVLKFDSTGGFVTQWGDSGSAPGRFHGPVGIAADLAGNVYVADRDNYRIQKFNDAGVFLTQWGAVGTGDGEFSWPIEVAVGPDGSVYVSDNNRIEVFAPMGATAVTQTTWGRLKARYR